MAFNKKRNSIRGFTIVELMIVLIVIAILVTASMPMLLRTKVTSNETVVQEDLKAVAAAVEIYRNNQPNLVYPQSLSDLKGFLDGAVAAGMQHGYHFVLVGSSNGLTYGCVAYPIKVGATGNRSFCMDQSGIIKQYSQETRSDGSGCPSTPTLVQAEPIIDASPTLRRTLRTN